MLKIGEFARLSQVSVKTLRHYDALGVLRPALVDPESGYRDRWLSTGPYRLAGPCREIYHRDPSHTDDPTTYITEIQYPLRPASRAS